MPLNIIQNATVTTASVEVKFSITVDVDTLVNANFALATDGATPTPVSDPFETISLVRDYDSIARTLNLYFKSTLLANTGYILTVSGLKTPYQEPIGSAQYTFTTGADVTQSPADQVPVAPEVVIEDSSIRDIAAVDLTAAVVVADATELQILSVDPNSDVAYYLDPSYNEGRIEIVFNTIVAANFVSTDYFKVQRKLVGRGMSRWEDMSVIVSSDSTSGIVIIYLPSNDATPVYGEAGATYWESGYKYRLRISGSIGSATDVLYLPYT